MKWMFKLFSQTEYYNTWLTSLCSGGESLLVTRTGGQWAGSGRGWPGQAAPSSSRAWCLVSCQCCSSGAQGLLMLLVLRSARDCDPSERLSSPKYWPGPPSRARRGHGCSPRASPGPDSAQTETFAPRPPVSVFWGQFFAFTPGCLPICIMHPLQQWLVNLNNWKVPCRTARVRS